MVNRDLILLEHISVCIQKILEYTALFDEEMYLKNSLVQDGVVRNLEIIGEATKKLSDDVRVANPTIEWKKMDGMRDKLIHDYVGVDNWAVWSVVKNIIPQLKIDIINIQNNLNK
jgi:uncharacterized protein with HEPN domain